MDEAKVVELRRLAEAMRDNDDHALRYIDRQALDLLALLDERAADKAEIEALRARVAMQQAVLEKIDAIRDDIIGRQRVNWSAHIYPLVAALGEAGFEGVGYDEARANAMTANDCITQLEAERDQLRERAERAEGVVQRVREACATPELRLGRALTTCVAIEAVLLGEGT